MNTFDKKLNKINQDTTLTPENANQKGFVWESDILLDPEWPLNQDKDIEHLVKKEGYKIGQPASRLYSKFQGLYAPLPSSNKLTE